MSTEIKSAELCPACLLQKKQSARLMNRPGQFYTSCANGHKFEDTDELNMLRAQARQKYPNVYAGLAPVTPDPIDPGEMASRNIIITSEEKKTLEDVAGMTFTGGGDLKGFLIAYVQDNKDKEAEIKSLRAQVATMSRRSVATAKGSSAALAPNQVIVTLPEWAMEGGVAAQAEHAGMSVEDWINGEISSYFENYFSQATPRR